MGIIEDTSFQNEKEEPKQSLEDELMSLKLEIENLNKKQPSPKPTVPPLPLSTMTVSNPILQGPNSSILQTNVPTSTPKKTVPPPPPPPKKIEPKTPLKSSNPEITSPKPLERKGSLMDELRTGVQLRSVQKQEKKPVKKNVQNDLFAAIQKKFKLANREDEESPFGTPENKKGFSPKPKELVASIDETLKACENLKNIIGKENMSLNTI